MEGHRWRNQTSEIGAAVASEKGAGPAPCGGQPAKSEDETPVERPDRESRSASSREAEPGAYGRAPRFRRMRCACRRCGAHTITDVGFVVAGSCPNCRSYELQPFDVPGAEPTLAPLGSAD